MGQLFVYIFQQYARQTWFIVLFGLPKGNLGDFIHFFQLQFTNVVAPLIPYVAKKLQKMPQLLAMFWNPKGHLVKKS